MKVGNSSHAAKKPQKAKASPPQQTRPYPHSSPQPQEHEERGKPQVQSGRPAGPFLRSHHPEDCVGKVEQRRLALRQKGGTAEVERVPQGQFAPAHPERGELAPGPELLDGVEHRIMGLDVRPVGDAPPGLHLIEHIRWPEHFAPSQHRPEVEDNQQSQTDGRGVNLQAPVGRAIRLAHCFPPHYSQQGQRPAALAPEG